MPTDHGRAEDIAYIINRNRARDCAYEIFKKFIEDENYPWKFAPGTLEKAEESAFRCDGDVQAMTVAVNDVLERHRIV